MIESCDQFKKIFRQILEFEANCAKQAETTLSPEMIDSTKTCAMLLLSIVIKNIEAISASGRQNYDSLLVCILFFAA